MGLRKINMEVLNESDRVAAEAAQQLLDKLRKSQKAKVKPTFKCHTTNKGKTGVIINGLGKPQFFYKAHLWAIVGDTPEAEVLRKEMREFLQVNEASLSNKDEE